MATLAGEVCVLDGEDGSPSWTRMAHEGGALSIAFSPDGAQIVSGGQDGRVRLFDAATGAEIRALEAGGDWAQHVIWPENERFASAAGRAVRFWSRDGELVGEAPNHPSTVSALFLHAQLGLFGAAHYGGISLLAVGAPKPTRRLAYRGAICVAQPSPNGRFVASGNQDATVRFWDLAAKEDASLTGYPEKVRTLAWAPDSTVLATGGGPNIVVWVCEGGARSPIGTRPVTLSRHAKRVTSLAFSAAGNTLFSVGEDGRVCGWTTVDERGPQVTEEDTLPTPLVGLAHHGGSGLLAGAGAGGSVVVWRPSR